MFNCRVNSMASKRPKYLNLFKIKLPLPGIVSFLHRVSGALLFAAIPLCIAGLQATLASAESFDAMRRGLGNPLVKLVLIGLLWGFLHHFFAGVRFLAMDFGFGLDLGTARRNSARVMFFSLMLTLLIGGWLW